jgi:hypothetical protein
MRMSKTTFWSIAFGLVMPAAAAAGQTLPAAAEPQPPVAPPLAEPTPALPESRWYGWQTLAPDAVAVGLAALALHLDSNGANVSTVEGLLAVSGGIFLLDGPIVHGLHGQPARAGWSIGLRVGLALLGWPVGFSTGEGACRKYAYDHEGCPYEYAAYGVIFGAATAAFLDAVILGHQPVPERARPRPVFVFAPLRDGGALSLAGRF